MRLFLSVSALFFLVGSLSGQQIEELIKRLGSDDWLERKKAEEALIRIGEKAGPLLVKAMQSSDVQIQELARRIIEEIGYAPPVVRKKCESLLARLLQKSDQEAVKQLRNMLKGRTGFFARVYLKFFFRGGKGPAYVSVSLGKNRVFCGENSEVQITIENKTGSVIWVPPFWLQTAVQILGERRPYLPTFTCLLSWGAFKALRLKPHQKVVIRKTVKLEYEGTVCGFSHMKQPVESILGEDLRPQTAQIKLHPKYLEKRLLILPPRKGRAYDFGFQRGKRWISIKLKASLKVEWSNGLQQGRVRLQIKPSNWVVGDLMKELKGALEKGNFPLRARLVVLEKGTFKMVAFDVRPKVKEAGDKIFVIWEKKLKKKLSADSLVWGYVWGVKGVWARANLWRPVVSPAEKIKEEKEEPQK